MRGHSLVQARTLISGNTIHAYDGRALLGCRWKEGLKCLNYVFRVVFDTFQSIIIKATCQLQLDMWDSAVLNHIALHLPLTHTTISKAQFMYKTTTAQFIGRYILEEELVCKCIQFPITLFPPTLNVTSLTRGMPHIFLGCNKTKFIHAQGHSASIPLMNNKLPTQPRNVLIFHQHEKTVYIVIPLCKLGHLPLIVESRRSQFFNLALEIGDASLNCGGGTKHVWEPSIRLGDRAFNHLD